MCSLIIIIVSFNFSILLYRVNSRELRRVVDEAIDDAEVKPNIIRFFRGAMFNMVSFNNKCIMKKKKKTQIMIFVILCI